MRKKLIYPIKRKNKLSIDNNTLLVNINYGELNIIYFETINSIKLSCVIDTINIVQIDTNLFYINSNFSLDDYDTINIKLNITSDNKELHISRIHLYCANDDIIINKLQNIIKKEDNTIKDKNNDLSNVTKELFRNDKINELLGQIIPDKSKNKILKLKQLIEISFKNKIEKLLNNLNN